MNVGFDGVVVYIKQRVGSSDFAWILVAVCGFLDRSCEFLGLFPKNALLTGWKR